MFRAPASSLPRGTFAAGPENTAPPPSPPRRRPIVVCPPATVSTLPQKHNQTKEVDIALRTTAKSQGTKAPPTKKQDTAMLPADSRLTSCYPPLVFTAPDSSDLFSPPFDYTSKNTARWQQGAPGRHNKQGHLSPPPGHLPSRTVHADVKNRSRTTPYLPVGAYLPVN